MQVGCKDNQTIVAPSKLLIYLFFFPLFCFLLIRGVGGVRMRKRLCATIKVEAQLGVPVLPVLTMGEWESETSTLVSVSVFLPQSCTHPSSFPLFYQLYFYLPWHIVCLHVFSLFCCFCFCHCFFLLWQFDSSYRQTSLHSTHFKGLSLPLVRQLCFCFCLTHFSPFPLISFLLLFSVSGTQDFLFLLLLTLSFVCFDSVYHFPIYNPVFCCSLQTGNF